MDLKKALGPILAIGLLVLIGIQTSDALRHSGVWGAPKPKKTPLRSDPYAQLEGELARFDPGIPVLGLRDPFTYGSAPRIIQTSTGPKRVAPPPPPPPKPVLTAILMDEDPRALLQYMDRNYSVKMGDDFAEFKVVSISREQVVIDGRGQRMVLRRPSKGE